MNPTLTKPNLPSQLHYDKVPKSVNFLELADLTEQAKRTYYYPIANTIFASALHYGASDPLVSLFWEAEEDRSNKEWIEISHLIYPDLLKLKKSNVEINIPVPLLKPWVQELTFYEVKRLNCCLVKEKATYFQQKRKHNRKHKKSIPAQAKYLLDKLAKLVPNYQELANRYLQPKP